MKIADISLLDKDNFLKYNHLIRQIKSRWWLKDIPKNFKYSIYCVDGVSVSMVDSSCRKGVRPVCFFEVELTDKEFWVKPSDLIGTNISFGKYEWTILDIIENQLFVICDVCIAERYFDPYNHYGPSGPDPVYWATSELKSWLETEGVKMITT